MKKIIHSNKFRHGAIATALTAAALAVLVLLNLIVVALAAHVPMKADLTKGKSYKLSEQSVSYLKELEHDVTITVLNSETSYSKRFRQPYELLKQYAMRSRHISLEFIDVVRDPSYIAAHSQKLKLSSDDVVVSTDRQMKVIKPYEMYLIEQTAHGLAITESRAEKAITGAIMTACSDAHTKVILLTGHGEVTAEKFNQLLADNGCELVNVNLITEKIPSDAQIAILAAPARDLGAEELNKLETFLNNDGKLGRTLLYLANPSVLPSSLTGISGFLAEWGVCIKDALVAESSTDRYFDNNPLNAIVGYADKSISEFMDTSFFCAMPNGLELECLFEQSIDGRVTTPLLSYTDTSYAIPINEGTHAQNQFENLQKSRPAFIRSVQPGQEAVSQVLISASASAVADPLIAAPSLANSEFFAGLLNQAVGRKNTLVIEARELDHQELTLTASHGYTMMAVYILIIPLGVILLGIFAWARKRRL